MVREYYNVYGEALLKVSPQDIVILPHHNILLNVLLQIVMVREYYNVLGRDLQ
jgi:hypothetical protein